MFKISLLNAINVYTVINFSMKRIVKIKSILYIFQTIYVTFVRLSDDIFEIVVGYLLFEMLQRNANKNTIFCSIYNHFKGLQLEIAVFISWKVQYERAL